MWGHGIAASSDGMFMACDAALSIRRSCVPFSSAAAGNEGLFNLGLRNGVVCLESNVPKELVEIELHIDVLKIDGNMAIAWSGSLEFTVERSGKSLIGSAASGSLVKVYRGSGRVLMAPVQ
ncbi:MAG: AIM24 family protein [Merdibacter sp.]